MQELQTKLQAALTANQISQTTLNNTLDWLKNEQVKEFHAEIQQLIDQEKWQDLNDAFYTQIEFGTAGIRGRTGLGSARINSWTIGTATQGLADYVASFGEAAKQKGVVIGSDTRLTSPQFVQLVADILTSNGITVYKFERPPQVGMFSFAVRLKKAQAGIYISASHNPPTDNGFKCYWDDGAQVLPPHDKAVTEAVKKVTVVKNDTPNKELLHMIGEDFDTVYRTRILQESVSTSRSAKVVYSPFHGTGQYGVLPVLQEAGFTVTTVDEQMEPDGNFPNVPGGIPNPENRESNSLTAQKVLEIGADVGISTDPDADRLGVVIPKDGGTVILDGNQTISLLAYFICHQLKEAGKLPSNGFLVRTVVSTPLLDAIAADFDLKIYNQIPVGFKFIGEIIRLHEDLGDELFIFGGEESFGCLKGSYARDKDASSAALMVAEMVSWLQDQGKTVWDLFNELQAKYGNYQNDVVNMKFEGAAGFDQMSALMNRLRDEPPKKIGAWDVVQVIDRKENEIKNAEGSVTGMVDGHKANILIFNFTEDGKNRAIIRPSGTEPKIKVYISLHDKSINDLEQLKAAVTSLIG